MIAPVPVHCFSIAFVIYYLSSEQERSVPLLYSYEKSGFSDNESKLFSQGKELNSITTLPPTSNWSLFKLIFSDQELIKLKLTYA